MSRDIFEAVARRELTPEEGAAILQARRRARRAIVFRNLASFALLPLGMASAYVIARRTHSFAAAWIWLLVNVAAALWVALTPDRSEASHGE